MPDGKSSSTEGNELKKRSRGRPSRVKERLGVAVVNLEKHLEIQAESVENIMPLLEKIKQQDILFEEGAEDLGRLMAEPIVDSIRLAETISKLVSASEDQRATIIDIRDEIASIVKRRLTSKRLLREVAKIVVSTQRQETAKHRCKDISQFLEDLRSAISDDGEVPKIFELLSALKIRQDAIKRKTARLKKVLDLGLPSDDGIGWLPQEEQRQEEQKTNELTVARQQLFGDSAVVAMQIASLIEASGGEWKEAWTLLVLSSGWWVPGQKPEMPNDEQVRLCQLLGQLNLLYWVDPAKEHFYLKGVMLPDGILRSVIEKDYRTTTYSSLGAMKHASRRVLNHLGNLGSGK